MKRYARRVLLAAAFLFLLAGLGFKVRAWAVPRLVKADWLADGRVPVTVPVNAWLLKEEQLLPSPERGQVRLLVRHGERVRAGAPVAEILPAGGEGTRKAVVYAPRAGVFCASTDGLEEVLRRENPLDLRAVEKLGFKNAAVETGSVVEKNQPVGKLVDNLAGVWCWFPRPQDERAAGRLAAGQWVGLLWEGEELRARVEKAAQGEVLLYLPHMPAELVPERRVKLDLVCGELKGFLVPPRAVVERNGQPGIYVILDRRATWVPVQVLGTAREGAVVTGAGLSPLTRYVTSPAWVREGDRLE
ncbi:HlyD family efflux transporter periplasmic adaptor subunit [Desulfovirgula thermocuniculi]|uniref:HlyD family efflux transporter periplasmic adaptor subunit n=1 Tax=Desulfovirgula thermocuniculi TaxID=348842 RepID=UPI000404E3D4|nr:HlyD family efflux transporter periplasmic adaptor subunit [Desulfovirgula thermocuniculi]